MQGNEILLNRGRWLNDFWMNYLVCSLVFVAMPETASFVTLFVSYFVTLVASLLADSLVGNREEIVMKLFAVFDAGSYVAVLVFDVLSLILFVFLLIVVLIRGTLA